VRKVERLTARELSTVFNRCEVFKKVKMAGNKNPAKDFCWWDLDGVVVCRRRRRAVVDGSLDLSARATCFFI
jgi:hypothetical protein